MLDDETCPLCGEIIDITVCWCGEALVHHTGFEGHTFVPMGCECYYSEEIHEDE